MSPRGEGDTATEGERQRFEEAGGTVLDLKMERWRRGPWAKECRGPPEGGKGKVINFYPELPEGTRAPNTLISPQ